MMIEDEELRSLYQSTCQGRLQVLQTGHLSIANAMTGDDGNQFSNLADIVDLETLRREAHSLKGDSQVMGLEEIADIAQQIEHIIKYWQQVGSTLVTVDERSHFLQPFLAPFETALSAIDQRVNEATAAEANDYSPPSAAEQQLKLQQIIAPLQAALSAAQENAPESISENTSQSAPPASEAPAENAPALGLVSVFITDADLRSLYRTTSTQRLHAITQALNRRVQNAQDNIALDTLRYESQGLKGDSLEAGQGAIAALADQFAAIANRLPSPHISLTESLQTLLWEGAQLIEQLIQNAIAVDENNALISSESHGELLTSQTEKLLETLSKNLESQLQANFSQANLDESLQSTTELIEDADLRDIFRTTSEDRLYRLETALSQLESAGPDAALLLDMTREVHSLKGDAQSTQLRPIAEIAISLEDLLISLKNKLDQALGTLAANKTNFPTNTQPNTQAEASSDIFMSETLTPEILESCRESIKAIGVLVQTATTGSAHHVNVTQLTRNLQALTTLTQETTPAFFTEENAHSSDITQWDTESEVSRPEVTNLEPPITTTLGTSRIEDEELREVYRTVSAERLQRLERGLAQLSSQPDNREVTAELLREAHSLKGDARSVGIDEVEQLAHATEDILIGIQQQPTLLSVDIGELLLRGLDAIAQLTDEAITGNPQSQIDTLALVLELRAVELPDITQDDDPQNTDLQNTGAHSTDLQNAESLDLTTRTDLSTRLAATTTEQASPAADDRLETIRVQTRALDNLASQTEQLTLTRIQTAQTTAKMMELVNLWGKWRDHQKSQKSGPNQNSQRLTNAANPIVNPYELEIDTLINRLRLDTQENSFRLELISQDLGEQVQNLRLLPVSTVLRSLPRVVRDLARQQKKSVELITEGEETTADKRILEDIQDSLMQLVRNAIDHGIETPEEREAAGKSPTAKLWIRSYQSPSSLVIEVADDGRGLDLEQVKQTAIRRKLYGSKELNSFSESQLQELIFTPGFSTRSFTTEISGRGVGLDVVRNQVERLKGNVQIESTPGEGCLFRLRIRTQLATANVVFVSVRGIVHAIPIEFLQTTMRLSDNDIVQVDGKDTIMWNQQTVPIRDLFEVLELVNSPAYQPTTELIDRKQSACLVLRAGDDIGAVLVDRLLDTQEVVFKPQSALLKRVRNVVGATILGNGDICSILNPPDLIKSVQRIDESAALQLKEPPRAGKPLLLLVEDSPPVRVQEKRLFETAGYEVVTAEDGLEGYEILRAGKFDAVISDIEMPNLDGLSLTAKIREHSEYEELPIILVTTLSSERDRQKGADMGANAYIVKGKFNQEVLLETLHRLI